MKLTLSVRLWRAAVLAVAVGVVSAVPAKAAELSISIGEPGFFGHLDIGGYPPPAVFHQQPVIIDLLPVMGPPVYLRVPPGHRRDWRRYCHMYDACSMPVYFVTDDWYQRRYIPHYQQLHRRPDRHDDYRHDDYRRPDHFDERRDHGRAQGWEHDRGRDHDNNNNNNRDRGNDRGNDRGDPHRDRSGEHNNNNDRGRGGRD